MKNITIYTDGKAYYIVVDGLTVAGGFPALQYAWAHILWMGKVATEEFTVTSKRIPFKQWRKAGFDNGFFDNLGT